MAQTGFRWIVPPEQAWGEMANGYIRAIHYGVYGIMLQNKPGVERWMKINAPWKDRSGNARQTLWTRVDEIPLQMVSLEMHHGMEYGFWLEVRFQGTYAIITPAINYWGPRIWVQIVAMLR